MTQDEIRVMNEAIYTYLRENLTIELDKLFGDKVLLLKLENRTIDSVTLETVDW